MSAVVGIILLLLHCFKASVSDFSKLLQPKTLSMLRNRLNGFVISSPASVMLFCIAEAPLIAHYDHSKWCMAQDVMNVTKNSISDKGNDSSATEKVINRDTDGVIIFAGIHITFNIKCCHFNEFLKCITKSVKGGIEPPHAKN